MQVKGLDHINIRTRDVEASARFYADVLGLIAKNTPTTLASDQARWLFDHTGQPIIHLYNGEFEAGSTGPIHHVALRCCGKDELIARLTASGMPFDVSKASAKLTQVFLRDVHGVLLELNFCNE